MVSILLSAARPYLILLACFTLTPPPAFTLAEHVEHNRRFWLLLYVYYTWIMLALSTWAAYINNFMLDVLAVDREVDSITNVLGAVQNVIVALVHAVYLFNMLIYYRPLCRIYATMHELERAINDATVSPQPTPGRHFGLRWRLATRAGALSLFLFVTLPCVNVPLYTDSMTPTNKAISALIHLLVQFKTVEYCVVVLLLQELLLRLHDLLTQLKLDLALATIASVERQALLTAISCRLRVNQHILARIWLLVTEVESYFTLPMLFLFLYNGVAITHIINWAYIMSHIANDCCRYLRLANVLILIVNILIPCWLSQCCINTYNQFVVTLHKLQSNGSDLLLTLRLREYSLQLMHQELIYTCGGFFDINLKHFGGFILTIITYVVILIQFKMQAEAERNTQHLHTTEVIINV